MENKYFKQQGKNQIQSQTIHLGHHNSLQYDHDKTRKSQYFSIKDYIHSQKPNEIKILPPVTHKVNGQSHLNTIALGFQFLCVETKIKSSLIGQRLIKNRDYVVTMETKQLIDILSEPNRGPTDKFQSFLLALISQLKVLLQQYISDPDVEAKLKCVPDSSFAGPSQYDGAYYDSPMLSLTSQDNMQLSSQINLIQDEPDFSYQENQTQMHYNFRALIQEQLDNLRQILDHFSDYTYGQFVNFFNDFNQFLNELNIEKKQGISAIKEFEDYINKCINFIIQIINIKCIQASNLIYRHINYKVTHGEELIIFSPSKLITKGLIYAKLLGKQLNITIVDTHLQHSVNQFKELTHHNIRCQYVLLTQLPVLLQTRKYSKCLMGAYTISINGNTLTRAGGQMLAIFMKQAKIPLIVCAQSYKFISEYENLMESTMISPQIRENDIEVEIVTNQLVTAILHQHGLITPSSLSSIDV